MTVGEGYIVRPGFRFIELFFEFLSLGSFLSGVCFFLLLQALLFGFGLTIMVLLLTMRHDDRLLLILNG
jgi:hypothetical protein